MDHFTPRSCIRAVRSGRASQLRARPIGERNQSRPPMGSGFVALIENECLANVKWALLPVKWRRSRSRVTNLPLKQQAHRSLWIAARISPQQAHTPNTEQTPTGLNRPVNQVPLLDMRVRLVRVARNRKLRWTSQRYLKVSRIRFLSC